jgi:hypothetical protein
VSSFSARAAVGPGMAPKPFSEIDDIVRKQTRLYAPARDQQWGSVMWAFIEDLYREYCLARLQEMRKYELSH